MNFKFKCLPGRKIRKGLISELPRIPTAVLETPLLLLSTKGGSIPHITHEVLQLLTNEQQAINISLPSTIQCYEGLKDYKKGISNFVGLQECLTFCSVHDPATANPVGYNEKDSVSIWSHSGRVSVNVNRYMDIMEAFQPDIYQTLCNGETNQNTTAKRNNKIVKTTGSMFKECLQRHSKSEVLKTSALIGVVEGGYNLEARKLSAEYLQKQPISGYAINGLHNNGATVNLVGIDAVKPIVEETLKCLPEDKLRIIHGAWKPSYLLELIEMGIDIFDSSLPYASTENNSALVFRCEYVDMDFDESQNHNVQYEISLKDERYKEDFGPILEGCTCLTCRKHMKAYIYHLIMNKELLASTLLMLHNLHHYIEFFKKIRNIPDDKKLKFV